MQLPVTTITWIFLVTCFPIPHLDHPQLLLRFSFFTCSQLDAEVFYGDTENLLQEPDDAHGHSASSFPTAVPTPTHWHRVCPRCATGVL